MLNPGFNILLIMIQNRQAVCNGQQQKLIFLRHLRKGGDNALLHQGGCVVCVEEFNGGDVEVFADRKEFCHGRQRFAGRNVVDITATVPEVITHSVFRNPFLHTQAGYSFTDKF